MACICPEEFNLKRLLLRYPYKAAFSTSPFVPLPLFLLYRFIIALYCLAWLVSSGHEYHAYFFLYLSNWTFILVTAYMFGVLYLSIVSCYDSVNDADDSDDGGPRGALGTRRFKSQTYIVGLTTSDDSGTDSDEDTKRLCVPAKSRSEIDNLKSYHKVVWLLFTLSSTSSLIVTGLYWTVQYPGMPANATVVNVHTLNSVFLLVEVVISNVPVRLLHHLYAHAFMSVYALFTVIYWASGGRDSNDNRFIYSVLKYESEPATAVAYVFLALIIELPLIHLLYFILFRLRAWIVSKID